METKNLIESSYLFYANPKTFPDWKYEERYCICMNIRTSWYLSKLVWRYKIKKGAYKDYIFEIPKEEALKVVIKNAIPNSDCPDLLPISAMKAEKPKDNQIPVANPEPLSPEKTTKTLF